MCDYSLHATASRPAKIADKLVTTSFVNSSTRGFATVGEPGVAVCLLPGTEVVFDREAEYDHILAAYCQAGVSLGPMWPGFGRSIWAIPPPITMRWNSPMGGRCL